MLEALLRAGLIAADQNAKVEKDKEKHINKTHRKERHKLWRDRCLKNRFGDIALFEIWDKAGRAPRDYLLKCSLCGKQLFIDSVKWVTPKKQPVKICPECFVDGRRKLDPLFPPLE